jgi:hypothetical protein
MSDYYYTVAIYLLVYLGKHVNFLTRVLVIKTFMTSPVDFASQINALSIKSNDEITHEDFLILVHYFYCLAIEQDTKKTKETI